MAAARAELRRQRLLRVSVLATGALLLGLMWRIRPDPGFAPRRLAAEAELGVEQPVTAVLLAFRAADTLLEVAVLMLAVIAVLILVPPGHSVAARAMSSGAPPSPLVVWLLPRLLPWLVLVAAYLWWAGASRPGGAFQAGTVLAAAGVILLLGQQLAPRPIRWGLRLVLSAGLLVFLATALLGQILAGALLAYPPGGAKALIMLVELAIALAVALALWVLVIGVPPSEPGRFPGDRP